MKKKEIYGYLISIFAAELVGLLAWLFSGSRADFYETLVQPPLAPPGWVFPVVWTILYALMGAASYRIWRSEADGRVGALVLYMLQLGVNFLWPIVFFRFERIGAAMAILILLCVLLVLTILQFRKVDRLAAILMLPYLVWSLFALYLNIGVYFLNT